MVKQKKERPEISVQCELKNCIISFGKRAKVKKFGNSGMVIIPKELIGKYVEISYLEEKQ